MAKKLLGFVLLTLCLVLSSQTYSFQGTKFDYTCDGERIYLDSPNQIVMNTKGIFFCADGEFYRTESVGHDTSGFYVPLAPMYWVCKNGHVNPLYVYPCPKCGAGSPGT